MSDTDMPDAGRPTILLVDDEAEIVTALQDLFEDSYEPLGATSPDAALEILRATPGISVIVSDQRMPGMTGDQFLARAREIGTAEALLLTGYADLEAVISAVNNGRIAGYSPKPWEPTALRSMVAGAHRRWALGRALETERRLLHGLLDSSADRIAFKDAQGRFVRLNAAKAAALGRTVAECLGHAETEFLSPERGAALARIEAAAAAQAVETEEEQAEAEGPPRWFNVVRLPIPEAGAAEFLVTIEHEVTEQRRMAERLRQADKMQALGTMAGGVAHDFNNLLTAILGNLQLAARRAAEDPRLSRLMRNATLAAERGAALTQRLLSFSRQRELALRPVDANALILGMEDLLGRSLGGAVRVRSALAADLWLARVDPGQLELAVLNLCINARDAMPRGGTITLHTGNLTLEPEGPPAEAGEEVEGELPPGDYVRLSVQDEGMGMSAEVLARAFEPFFTTKEIGKGTGLGLSMVYGLMRQSGGGVRISSQPGEGTCVELLLPRALSDAPAPAEAAPAARRGRRARILVVDDDSTVREVTTAFLSDLGHDILEAADGPAALRLLEEQDGIDALVADLTMPRMTGMELALRARAVRPSLPVLLVTGYAEMEKVPKDFPVLHKPFQQDELARRVAEMVGG